MVTGCLKGSTDGYYLIEKDGTMRLLMDHNQDPCRYAVIGSRSAAAATYAAMRVAAARRDPHGLRFFQVEEVLGDHGVCEP